MDIAVDSPKEAYENPVTPLKNKAFINDEIKPNDGYSMELVTGEAVPDLLFNDHKFQKSWDQLFESCPWATIFQQRQFIGAWYRVYRNEHLPILIIAFEKGQLKGVLPVVLLNGVANGKQKSGRITGAGHYEAEYQSWLAAAADGELFIKKALAVLMKQYRGFTITFRFIPPGTPIGWAKKDKKWSQCSLIQSFARPYINLTDPELEKSYWKRKHFKKKLNRLSRTGDVSFETINDYETFERDLNEMAALYDFRQSALFNKCPFREDTVKKEFLLALFRLQLLHVTVLRVNEKIIAAVVLVKGKDWIYLAGIICHTPFNAQIYSPGYLHLILLTKQLFGEGVPNFDLSPGYDSYKDDLANRHDEVHELVISSSKKFHIKRKIKIWLHARFVANGIRPMTAELNWKRYFYLLRKGNASFVVKSIVKRFQRKRMQQLFLVQAYTAQPDVNISLNKDNINDLMKYELSSGHETKWEFLSNAMRRLETGQHCYTWMENGQLLACAWFRFPEPAAAEKDSSPVHEKLMVWEGYYCHAAAKSRIHDFISKVIDAGVNNDERSHFQTADQLFCKVLGDVGERIE